MRPGRCNMDDLGAGLIVRPVVSDLNKILFLRTAVYSGVTPAKVALVGA